jgi:hypothetical protein
MVLDHFEDKAHCFTAMAGKLQKQAVAVVQLGTLIACGRELLDIGTAEIICLNELDNLSKGGLDAAGVEVFVE